MNRVVEIRTYNLKPNSRDEFERLVLSEALPMLLRWGVDVVAYNASLHDPNVCYLMRSYASIEDRQQSQDAFYGSDEWRNGPREPFLALLEGYSTVVIEVDEATLAGLRQTTLS